MCKVVTGMFSFAFGIGIGLVVGVLIAPKAGNETRADIKDKFDDMCETGKIKVNDIIEKSKTTTNDMIGKGKDVVDKMKNKKQEN